MSIRAISWAYLTFEAFDMPPTERLVLLALCFKHHDKSNKCYPSYDTIAQMAGCKRRKAIEAVASLSDWGLITKQERRVSGRQGSNDFILFGRLAVARKPASRVHGGALWQSVRGDTPHRVSGGTPNKEEPLTKQTGATELRVIHGGQS